MCKNTSDWLGNKYENWLRINIYIFIQLFCILYMSSEYFAYGDSKLYNIQNGLFLQNKKFVIPEGSSGRTDFSSRRTEMSSACATGGTHSMGEADKALDIHRKIISQYISKKQQTPYKGRYIFSVIS